jgi:ketosteroid isomerase-like protein
LASFTLFVSTSATLSVAIVAGVFGIAAHAEVPDNLALVTRLFETTLNTGDVTEIDQIMTEDYVQHNPFVPQGRDGFVNALADFRAAFPDYRSRMDRIVATDEEVWVLHTASGTHCSPYFGMDPDRAPL